MIPNVSPVKQYVPQGYNAIPMAVPQNQPQVAPVMPQPAPTGGVYSSIPYNPIYGATKSPLPYAPKISTVSIELNGLEPPKVPSPFECMQSPVMQQPAPIYAPYDYNNYQPAPAPYYQPMPMPPQPVYQEQPAPPPSVIDNTQNNQAAPQPAPAPVAPAPTPVNNTQPPVSDPQKEQAAVKPLLDALSVISPKEGQPAPTEEQKEKAIQTIVQFARVAEAANKMYKETPDKPEVKDTKQKVDNLIKPNLIKEDTFLGLADIATKDTSSLPPQEKAQADQNRVISMYTLSMLQKYFKQEANEEAPKINVPPISMNEVPGIVQVVDIAKKDPNPDIRAAGIAALTNLVDTKEPKDVATIKTIIADAKNDPSDIVKNAANESETVLFPPQQAQPTPATQPA